MVPSQPVRPVTAQESASAPADTPLPSDRAAETPGGDAGLGLLEGRQPERPRRRRRVLLTSLVVLLVLAVLGVWTVVCALRAQQELQAVRADVAALRADPPPGAAPLLERLRTDRDRAAEARALLDQPGPRIVAAVPVLGRSVAAERAVARAGEAVLVTAVDVVESADGVLQGGAVDLARLSRLETALAEGSRRSTEPLAELAAAETDLTPGLVQSAVAEAREVLLGLDGTFADAAAGARALGGLLGADGPREVLVALENNAELRGRGGLVSVFARGETRDGRLELTGFEQVEDVGTPIGREPTRVTAPPEVTAHYGPYLADSTLWKTSNMAADGAATGATLAAVAGASLGVTPDVVVMVDVPAMAAVVEATDPVALPDGRVVTGDELVDLLLVDAYEGTEEGVRAQSARRARLTALASGAAGRLLGGGLGESPVPLARALVGATTGRHLAVWSARPEEQAALEQAGLSGSVDPEGDDIAMVTTNNLSGDKLDLYVERELAVDVTVGPEAADVVQTLRLHNTAPEDLPWYVQGKTTPGRSVSLLDMAASPDAVDLAFTADGQPVPVEVRQESGSTRLVTTVELERGEDVEIRLSYRVPVQGGEYALRLVPQPLARDARLDLSVRAGDGSRLGRVEGAARSGGESGAGGEVRESGPFDAVRRIQVGLHEPDGWERFTQRVRGFWSEPVRVG